jgi:hypothetical protein
MTTEHHDSSMRLKLKLVVDHTLGNDVIVAQDAPILSSLSATYTTTLA